MSWYRGWSREGLDEQTMTMRQRKKKKGKLDSPLCSCCAPGLGTYWGQARLSGKAAESENRDVPTVEKGSENQPTGTAPWQRCRCRYCH